MSRPTQPTGTPRHHVVTFADSMAAGAQLVGDIRGDPVEIVPYDARWRDLFDDIATLLRDALGPTATRIDHVGSTAVPGLAAKPVVDVQVSVIDVEAETDYLDAIERLGFALRFREAGHRYFRPPPGLPRLWQVHVCGAGSGWERVHLLFRDYLRMHGDEAAAYGTMKRAVAAQHRDDRIAYNDAKGQFIVELLERAEDWAKRTGWTVEPARGRP